MPSEARVALITGCGKPVDIGNATARALGADDRLSGIGHGGVRHRAGDRGRRRMVT